MPNNVNMISFGAGQAANADLQAQQLELQRRQKLAEFLRQQSLTPIDQQQVSGRVVPISPFQALAKVGTGLLGNYAQQGLDAKEAALGEEARKRTADALRSLAPAGTFEQPQDYGQGITSENIDGGQGVDQSTKDRWAKILAANQLDPQLGRDLLKNELTLTDDQRNLLAQGIDPKAFGRARLAKEQAGGVTNVSPGTSVFSPGTNQFIAAAPDFNAGLQGSFGPNGPQVGRIAGSENIAALAGEKERASAAGRAGYNTITVNTPNGPVLLTEEQAARMAGGGVSPNGPVNFTASNGVSLNLSGRSPQQIIQAAQNSNDPQVMQAVGEWMRSGNQQQIGIPLMSKAQETAQVGKAQNAVALEKDLAEKAQSPEAQQRIKDASSMLSLLEEAAPYLDSATSSTAGKVRDTALGVVGRSTRAGEDAARLAVIGGQLTGMVPKFTGPSSDKDVALYAQMAGRLGDPTVPSEVKQAAWQTMRRLSQKYLDQNQNSMAAQAVEKTSGKQKPKSLDDLLNQYGGR